MTVGRSLHIGLNHLDPAAYGGWPGTLYGCENDAHDMRAIASAAGFGATVRLNAIATRDKVLSDLAALAEVSVPGDIALITYSGHGGQIPDVSGDEADGMDETWCLYDGELVDDELYHAYAQFKPGVRVLVLSDSCHSGTVIRAMSPLNSVVSRARLMPTEIGSRVYLQNKAFYDSLTKPGAEDRVCASVLLISGCQDNEVSYDGNGNGAFTAALKRAWNGGKFKGGYSAFRSAISRALNGQQHPDYRYVGTLDKAFYAQKPFTV